MKKLALVVMVIAVAVMFSGIADAATSTSCTSCAKPCSTCAKPSCSSCSKGFKLPNLFGSSCNKCAKPSCSSCAKPAAACPKCVANPCACVKVTDGFKRDVLGNKIPLQTVQAGNALTDKATRYEENLISGQ